MKTLFINKLSSLGIKGKTGGFEHSNQTERKWLWWMEPAASLLKWFLEYLKAVAEGLFYLWLILMTFTGAARNKKRGD